MVHVDVAFLPAEIAAKAPPKQSLAVLVDVVRATTTIVTACAHGCSFVAPVLHVEEAFQVKQRSQGDRPLLLGGERGGKRVKGFDLGNSPREYTAERIQNTGIVFSTTNGTRTLLALQDMAHILIGSFLNLSTLCQTIAVYCRGNEHAMPVLIACSGVENTFALEDTVCAGMMIHQLSRLIPELEKTTSARSAEILYHHYQTDLLRMLRLSDGGRRLSRIGLDADLPTCAEVDRYSVVPEYRNGRIRL